MAVAFGFYQIKQREELENGVVAFKQGDYKIAVLILEPLARKGNRTATELMGMAYAFGHGVPKDRQLARQMLSSASADKLGQTFLFVAEEFDQGKNVRRDEQEMQYWLVAAAEAGNEKAKARLTAMKK